MQLCPTKPAQSLEKRFPLCLPPPHPPLMLASLRVPTRHVLPSLVSQPPSQSQPLPLRTARRAAPPPPSQQPRGAHLRAAALASEAGDDVYVSGEGGRGKGGGERGGGDAIARTNTPMPLNPPPQIMSEPAFNTHIASATVVVTDFMARWCRKCIYVKPRLVTLMASKFPNVPIAFVDVNAVPSTVVRGAGVSKMPTICIYVNGEQAECYVAGESATTAVLKLEAMVEAALKKVKEDATK